MKIQNLNKVLAKFVYVNGYDQTPGRLHMCHTGMGGELCPVCSYGTTGQTGCFPMKLKTRLGLANR